MSIKFEDISFYYDSEEKSVFTKLSAEFSAGVTSLIGQNGTGKTTFMLLAGGRLLPKNGRVLLAGKDTRSIRSEDERNLMASFVYQNMEFEAEESVGELFQMVFEAGRHAVEDITLIDELVNEFELSAVTNRTIQSTSKGEMQKINIAFSLLYGSEIILMDEPVFALENHWKDKVLSYLRNYVHRFGITLYYSIHELELSKKYSDNAILFFKDGSISYGPVDQLLSRENVEDAYQVPMELLYKRERLFRDHLTKPVNPEKLASLEGQVKVIEE